MKIDLKDREWSHVKVGLLQSISNADKVSKCKFEDNPLIIRKIELTTDEIYISLAFFGHTHDKVFGEKYFKLINPIFFD